MLVAELVEYGKPLQTVERPEPEPGPGQIRVRVHAATVNPVDWLVAGGILRDMTPHLSLPLVPGWERPLRKGGETPVRRSPAM